jgi:hypothetical protein
MGGTLVRDSEGLSKLATGDTDARAHLATALARRAWAAVSAKISSNLYLINIHALLVSLNGNRQWPEVWMMTVAEQPESRSSLI